jgi:hypothetical protein
MAAAALTRLTFIVNASQQRMCHAVKLARFPGFPPAIPGQAAKAARLETPLAHDLPGGKMTGARQEKPRPGEQGAGTGWLETEGRSSSLGPKMRLELPVGHRTFTGAADQDRSEQPVRPQVASPHQAFLRVEIQ